MSATIEFIAPPGQTLTLLVCPWNSLVVANGAGDAATETARAGVYQATVDETPALSGWHTAHVVSSAGWELPAGDVKIVDGEVCKVGSRDEENDTILAAVNALGEIAGAGEHAISVTVTAGGAGLQGVLVRVFDGATLVDRQTTGVGGTCTLQLNTGTYRIVATKTGLQSSTTDGYAVTAPVALPIALSALTITPSSGASFATAYALVLTPAGEPSPGETCTLQLIDATSTDEGRIYHGIDSPKREAISDADGIVQWANVPIGGKIKYWAGAADRRHARSRESTVKVAKVVAGVFALPSLVAE